MYSGCSSTDVSPLQWRTAADIPVSNETFFIKKEFDERVNIDSIDLSDPDPDKNGDTLKIISTMDDSTEFETHLDQIDTQSYTIYIKPFTLKTKQAVSKNVPLPLLAGTFSVQDSVLLDGIYQVKFSDSSVNILPLKITNNLDETISSISVFIPDFDTTITVGPIPKRNQKTLNFNVRNKSISRYVKTTLSLTLPQTAGSLKNAKNGSVSISFSLDGLLVQKCCVDGSLLANLSQSFHNDCNLSDTFKLHYIDIENGQFTYKIINFSNVTFKFSIEHFHLWKTAFCENSYINDINKIKMNPAITLNDSINNYYGFLARNQTVFPESDIIINNNAYSSSRFFSDWNDTLKKSFIPVELSFSGDSRAGERVSVAAGDSLVFKIFMNSLRFSKCSAHLMKTITQNADTQEFAIPYPRKWPKTTRDSLRGRLLFHEISSKMDLLIRMSKGTFIDSLGLGFTIAAKHIPSARITIDTTITRIQDGLPESFLINMVDIINAFPDTVQIISNIRIPRGSEIQICNDNRKYNKRHLVDMSSKVNLHLSLIPELSWDVRAPINLDLGGTNLSVAESFRYIRKLDNRQIALNMDLFNNTNLNMTTFIICAPKNKRSVLKSLPSSTLFAIISSDSLIRKYGFINFTGAKGIVIPKRSTASSVSIQISSSELDSLLDSDSCYMRYVTSLSCQNGIDGLTDTDFVKINSYVHAEGTNNSDSLFIW